MTASWVRCIHETLHMTASLGRCIHEGTPLIILKHCMMVIMPSTGSATKGFNATRLYEHHLILSYEHQCGYHMPPLNTSMILSYEQHLILHEHHLIFTLQHNESGGVHVDVSDRQRQFNISMLNDLQHLILTWQHND